MSDRVSRLGADYFEDNSGTDTLTDEGTHVEVSYAEGTIILDNVGLGDVAASDFVFL